MSSTTETQLIRRAKDGSTLALNDLFERYGNRLLRLIRLRLGPSLRQQVESRDILQQTLLKAFRGIDRFEGEGAGSLMGWFGAIARNELRDQRKFFERQGRDVARNVALDGAHKKLAEQVRTETSRLDLEEREQRLEQAIEALADAYREVIMLRRFEELSFREIADSMRRSPDACRVLHARAMAALTLNMKALDESMAAGP